MPSDTPTPKAQRIPRRMPREDFTRRVLFFAKDVIALDGADPTPEMVTDAKALFGAAWRNILGALRAPPWICPSCERLHHAAQGGPCYECEEAAVAAAERERQFAGILALLPPELAEKVRAELAQKGGA